MLLYYCLNTDIGEHECPSLQTPHGHVDVPILLWLHYAHRDSESVPVRHKAWRVIGQTHPIPLPCKLSKHKRIRIISQGCAGKRAEILTLITNVQSVSDS